MPLRTGKSKKTIGANIGEMLHKFKMSGSIGNTHPGSTKKARQIAAAAAYSKAGRTKRMVDRLKKRKGKT
jgi:hypothetical protein